MEVCAGCLKLEKLQEFWRSCRAAVHRTAQYSQGCELRAQLKDGIVVGKGKLGSPIVIDNLKS